MGKVIISERTVKDPITLIGEEAGICWGADTSDTQKNYKRGISCLKRGHGRTWEFPDVYLTLDGYSARVIREWYTHIGGAPTRLQASTRYIDYQSGFDYIIPKSIKEGTVEYIRYINTMKTIQEAAEALEEMGVPREDSAMILPLGMATTIVGKYNLRTLIDMSHQRMCTRAYWEYRELMRDLCAALSEYSDEWAYLVQTYFMPKCELYGYCSEAKSCGRRPKKED